MRLNNSVKLSLMAICCLILNGCTNNWHISELHAQKIERSSKILYKYDAWGGRDSHAFGYRLLDSTETFKLNLQDDLPFTQLREIPNNISIKGLSYNCNNDCGKNFNKTKPNFLPLRIENTKKGSININTIIYQYRGFSEKSKGLGNYRFETFKETKDSLFFYNLDNVGSIDLEHLDILKIKKIEVVIYQDREGNINKIVVEDLIDDSKTNEIILSRTYFLTPKTKLKSARFSEYGIFKEVAL